MMQNKWITRTHDRLAFKKCREAWNFGSKIRENWEANETAEYFNFGSAIHKGIEVFHNPTTWDSELKVEFALVAFVDEWTKFIDNYKAFGNMASWEEQKTLGIEMLKNYAEWSEHHDKDLIPLQTELEFEVQIPVHPSIKLPPNFTSENGYLFFYGFPVYYQGRVDSIKRHRLGGIYLEDTKTKGQALSENDMQFLELDEQLGSYAWALREVGINLKGILYTQLLKSYPTKPKVLKNGSLSKDKSQNTTVELYKQAIIENGLNEFSYAEHLEWLEANPSKSVQRTKTQRSDKELDNLGIQICLEAIDMLNDPSIYPNPRSSYFDGCDRCQFRTPCLAKREGSDPTYYLEEAFHKRDS